MNFRMKYRINLNLILYFYEMFEQVCQCVLCIIMGSFDLTKEHHQRRANMFQNVCSFMNVVSVAANVLISSFEMKSMDDMMESMMNETHHYHYDSTTEVQHTFIPAEQRDADI